jgi:hypothetical protein
MDRFPWLVEMTFRPISPAYLLLAVVVILSSRRGLTAALRAIVAVSLVHVGPLAMLLWATVMYGAAPGVFGWVSLVQLGLAGLGIAIVVKVTRPLGGVVPDWSLAAFFSGAAIINIMTLWVSGMALANDWV